MIHDGKEGGHPIERRLMSDGVLCCLLLGRAATQRGIQMYEVMDPASGATFEAALTTPSPGFHMPVGNTLGEGPGKVTKQDIIDFYSGDPLGRIRAKSKNEPNPSAWHKKKTRQIQSNLLWAIVARRVRDRVHYIVGFVKAAVDDSSSDDSSIKKKKGGGGIPLPDKIGDLFNDCAGVDNVNWAGNQDLKVGAGSTQNPGTIDTSGYMVFRESGRIAVTCSDDMWFQVQRATPSARHKDKNWATYFKVGSVRSDEKVAIKFWRPSTVDGFSSDSTKGALVNPKWLTAGGSYRFGTNWDCATSERLLYGRRTVAYLGRLAGQLKIIAGMFTGAMGHINRQFYIMNQWKIYQPRTGAGGWKSGDERKALTLDFEHVHPGEVSGVQIHNPETKKVTKEVPDPFDPNFSDPIIKDVSGKQQIEAHGGYLEYYLPPAAQKQLQLGAPIELNIGQILPPLEEALCAEFLQVSDCGGISAEMRWNASTNKIVDHGESGFATGVPLPYLSMESTSGNRLDFGVPNKSDKLIPARITGHGASLFFQTPNDGTTKEAFTSQQANKQMSRLMWSYPNTPSGNEGPASFVWMPDQTHLGPSWTVDPDGKGNPKGVSWSVGRWTAAYQLGIDWNHPWMYGGPLYAATVKPWSYKSDTEKVLGKVSYYGNVSRFSHIEGHHGDPIQNRAGDTRVPRLMLKLQKSIDTAELLGLAITDRDSMAWNFGKGLKPLSVKK